MRFRVCEEGRGRFRFYFSSKLLPQHSGSSLFTLASYDQFVHILFRYKACCVLELIILMMYPKIDPFWCCLIPKIDPVIILKLEYAK